MVIMLVQFQVFHQLVDTLRQQRNLYFG